jgi:hypothetical protein
MSTAGRVLSDCAEGEQQCRSEKSREYFHWRAHPQYDTQILPHMGCDCLQLPHQSGEGEAKGNYPWAAWARVR